MFINFILNWIFYNMITVVGGILSIALGSIIFTVLDKVFWDEED